MISTLLILASTTGAWAHIPKVHTILDKTAKNDGHGTYVIEQEVQFQTEPETIITREQWVIQDGENMQVSVRVMGGAGAAAKPLAIVYRGGIRYVIEAGAGVQQTKMATDAVEPFFHFRSFDGLGHYLAAKQIIPNVALAEHRLTALKNFKYEADPHVALARVGSTITFALGQVHNGALVPALWIDQDRFVIKKIHFPSNAEVVADNHEQFAKGLVYPKDRTITWDDKSAQIRTISIKSIGEHNAGFNPQTIANEEKLNGSLPNAPLVHEFYSRFR
jgi:hypothetical protein